MRTHTLRLALLLTAATALASCEQVLDIDDSNAHELMVLNAVPADGHRAFVNISHTYFFLDTLSQYPVSGAAPTLYINGIASTPDSVSQCNYFFPDTLHGGDSLSIDVATPHGLIQAHTYVPQPPAVSNARAGLWHSPSFNFYLVPFTLSDDAASHQRYRINVVVRDSGLRHNPWTDRTDTVDSTHVAYFAFFPSNEEITSNTVSPNIPLANLLYANLLFTDSLINGRSAYQVNLAIPLLIDTNEVRDSLHTFKHWYTVRTESITPARWNYLISVSRANSLASYFAEQAKPYTNVSGALGIFAGGSSWSFSFDPDTIPTFGSPTAPPSPAAPRSW